MRDELEKPPVGPLYSLCWIPLCIEFLYLRVSLPSYSMDLISLDSDA